MKLFEGVKQLKGSPAQIPESSRDNLPEFFVEMGFKVGAEVGVYKGEFAEKFCKAGLKIYAVDPWRGYNGAGGDQKRQERQDFLFEHTQRVLTPYSDCTIIRKTSMDALEDFKDQSLDFVYIDADHCFRGIAEDIYEWTKKVRIGGVVSGHDYFHTIPQAKNVLCHVGPVVDAFVKIAGITNWYTFGRSKPLENEAKQNKFLSWMFVREEVCE